MQAPGRAPRRLAHLAPVAAVCAWNLWFLRATLVPVAYLDDASMHEQMVRAATTALRAGDLPLTRWFPYLSLGSPHFLHYQSGGATLAGLAGLVVGPDTAFRWSLYLLVALWPVAVYASARLWGFERWVACAAAVVSPFLASVPGIGYEQKAYLWIGYGLWAQLWASWALPFAWACTWRAFHDRRWTVPAVACITLTVALHFETGYLAFGAVPVLLFVAAGPLARRAGTAALVLGGGIATSTWVTVPVILQGRWAAVNETLAPTGLVRGYGARTDLGWLVTGRTFDNGRLPVVTLAVAAGIVASIIAWRRSRLGRAMVCLFTGSLLLSFGPTTWGPLADVVPGHQDLFFRRFVMGVHLTGIYLAGIGALWVWGGVRHVCVAALDRWRVGEGSPARALVVGGAAALLGLALLVPALVETGRYDSGNASAVAFQHADGSALASLDAIVARVEALPKGRVYAGAPGTWGDDMVVGSVPVYKYLEALDVDEVGYTLRTAALMTGPEEHFDEAEAGDYPLFGIRYLILPVGKSPPVPAQQLLTSGPFVLWEVPGVGYFSVVDIVGTLSTNRAGVGAASVALLRSGLFLEHADLAVAWGSPVSGQDVATAPPARSSGPPGIVRQESVDLADGRASAQVVLSRPAAVELAASFDPGWRATVDGRPAPTVMLAPAVVGVRAGRGAHTVTFTYGGYPWYPLLFALAGISFVALWLATRRRRPDVVPAPGDVAGQTSDVAGQTSRTTA